MNEIPEEIRKMFPNSPIHMLDIDDNGDLHILASSEPISNEPDFEHLPMEQVNQFLLDHGYDPEQVDLNGKILVEALIEHIDLRTRAEAAERELAALKERTRWIPVSERLPLVVGGYDVVVSIITPQCPARFVAIRGFMGIEDGWNELSGTVTHWKERPFLPPEAENDK